MQEDEGFTDENTTEFEQVRYVPSFAASKYKRKVYTNPLKLVTQSPLYDSSLFINPILTKQLSEHFHQKHHSRIVYPFTLSMVTSSKERGLQFDSNYEGANLQYVLSEDFRHYDLYMKPDSNTRMHFQWFCFKVRNRNSKNASFTIKNFTKRQMLYSRELRPYYKYTKGQNDCYLQLQSEVSYEQSKDEDVNYYQLHFSFSFIAQNQQVEICSQPAYTVQRCDKVFRLSPFVKTTLAKSVLGHPIDGYLLNELQSSRAVVVVFARQHPGQSVSSWLVEGFADKLVDIDHSNIYWIIVPIINIDGVMLGNNRTGMLGFDFNRHWYIDQYTNRTQLFPELIGILTYFNKRAKQFFRKTKLFIDFHGHSSQENVFAYGPPHHKTSDLYQLSRLLPYLISKKNIDFSLSQCTYEISPKKKYCARAIFDSKFGFHFSYTIESSFGVYRGRRVNQKDMLKMGGDICQGVLQFLRLVVLDKEKEKKNLNEVLNLMRNEYIGNFVDPCDDSGSEQEDKTTNRRYFEDKVFNILSKHHLEENESELVAKSKLKKGIYFSEQSERKQKQAEGHRLKRFNSLRSRYKTQQSLQSKPNRLSKNSSVFLPKLKSKQQGSSLKSDNTSIFDCSFQNMSLSQIKARLMNLRNSKFGKRILIIN